MNHIQLRTKRVGTAAWLVAAMAAMLAITACNSSGGEVIVIDSGADGALPGSDGAVPGADAGPLPAPECGDGERGPGESCEPGGWNDGLACADIDGRFNAGMTRCADDCQFDLTECVMAGTCGNGILEDGESCDDGNTEDQDGCSALCALEAGGIRADDEPPPPMNGPAEDSFVATLCNADALADQPLPARGVRLRLRVHVVRHRGNVTATRDQIGEWLREANVQLERAGVTLEMVGRPNVIDDPEPGDAAGRYFNMTAARAAELRGVDNDPNAFDLYFVNSYPGTLPNTVKLGEVDVVGGAVETGPEGNKVRMILDGMISTPQGAGATISHELGHLLGLYHTHSRLEQLSDTPTDPGPAALVTGGLCTDNSDADGCDCRPGNSACTPTCSDGSAPQHANVMSYYDCADDEDHGGFTQLQIKRMHCQARNVHRHALIGLNCVDRDGDGYSADPLDDCEGDGGLVDCDDRQPTVSPEAAETCNGHDDDCDGEIDEDTAELRGQEGGACEQCLARCVDGAIEACGAVDPAPETCNGEDDDCDGAIDEDVDPAGEAVEMRCPDRGICANGGARQVCRDGAWACELPQAFMDEECPPRSASRICAHGSLRDESCDDGIDNDCDGVRDEHNPVRACRDDPRIGEVGQECFASPLGRCGANGGVYQCLDLAEQCGVAIDCVGATFPENERCDAVDWDCDGAVWDRNDRDGDGYGDCGGQVDCDERRADVNPGAREVCDGVDNDCDGQRDEGFGNIRCGQGICARRVPACLNGDLRQQCGAAEARQGARVEECDGLDNDCDGQTDEGQACLVDIALPDIGVFNIGLVRGDREFGGNGPSMVMTVNIEPHPDVGLNVVACVDAQELGGDTRGRRCDSRHVRGPNRRVALVDDRYEYFRVQYIDNDHSRDNAIAERAVGSLYVSNPAVVGVSCNGDRRGDDICGNAECTGCQFDLGAVPVRILR